MTKSTALDFARDNIRVNAVCPGDTFVDRWIEKGYFEYTDQASLDQAIKTASDYIPMGRFGKPEEIANAVLFLASDDSSFVTGHLFLVDGGNPPSEQAKKLFFELIFPAGTELFK